MTFTVMFSGSLLSPIMISRSKTYPGLEAEEMMEDQEVRQKGNSFKFKSPDKIPWSLIKGWNSLRILTADLTLPPNKTASKPAGDLVKKQLLIKYDVGLRFCISNSSW